MPEHKFENPWAPPLDPAYVAFEAGWKSWVNDGGAFRYPRVRWHPRKANWFTYAPPRWEMIDRSVPDLKPPTLAIGFTLPQTFRAVHDQAQRYPQYPNLVWNPHTGVWREARDTGGGKPPPPPPPPPPVPPGRVDEAKLKARADREREMNAVYDEYSRGAIDIVTLNARIAEIDARYAPLLG